MRPFQKQPRGFLSKNFAIKSYCKFIGKRPPEELFQEKKSAWKTELISKSNHKQKPANYLKKTFQLY